MYTYDNGTNALSSCVIEGWGLSNFTYGCSHHTGPLPHDRIQGELSAFRGTLANVCHNAPGGGGRAQDMLSMLTDFEEMARSLIETLGSRNKSAPSVCLDKETGQCKLGPEAELELKGKLAEIDKLQAQLASTHLKDGSDGCGVCLEAALIARQLRNIINAWLEKRVYIDEEYQIKSFKDWEKHMFDPVLYDVQLRYKEILRGLLSDDRPSVQI